MATGPTRLWQQIVGPGHRGAARRHNGDPARLERHDRRLWQPASGARWRKRVTQIQTQFTTGSADLVVVEMLRSNLDALMEEMLHLLVRSAYSTLMRESRDCSFLITD